MSQLISDVLPGRSDSADELRRAAFGGRIYGLLLTGMLLVMLAGCHDEAPTDLLLAAEREAPIGWVRVRLFRDSTFELSLNRGSWKRGTFRTAQDTIIFDYLGETDSLRQRAVVVENNLRFSGGGGERVDFAEITFRE